MSSSGGDRIQWAAYLEDRHNQFLRELVTHVQRIHDRVNDAFGNVENIPNPAPGPYWGKAPGTTVYDYLDDAADGVLTDTTMEGLLSSYVDTPGGAGAATKAGLYHDYIIKALEDLEADEHGVRVGYINNIVNNYRVNQRSHFEGTEMAKFETGSRDANAAGNHSFAIGRAYLWRTFQDKNAEFAAKVYLEMYDRGMQRKNDLAKVGIAQMGVWVQYEGLTSQFQLQKALTHVQWRMDLAKVADGIANDAYTSEAKHAAIKVEHTTMSIYRHADAHRRLFEAMASIHGAVPVRSTEYNTAANVLAYGLAGAASGGQNGGGASGAGWGALGGMAMGFVNSAMS